MATAKKPSTPKHDSSDARVNDEDSRRSDDYVARSGYNRPDFVVYAKSGRSARARLIRLGAVWRHRRGDGFNLILSAHALDGEYVCFPPRDEEEEERDV